MDTRTNENNDNVINVPATTAAKKVAKDAPKLSILDQLKEEISKEVTRPDIEIEVPERAGVTVRFSPNITNEQLKAWRRNSTNRKTDELDSIKFSCYVVGQTIEGIYFNDELVQDASGNVVTFASPEILEMTNTTRPLPDAIRAFYATDPHLESVAIKILDYAGYGDEVEAEDPTKG
tara:strand:- start:250 stop:780 length:531 start_codon:yes stop_codon:yes gene_type:complete